MPKLFMLLCFTTALYTSAANAASINYVCEGKKPHSMTGFFITNTIVETADEYSGTGKTRIYLDNDYIHVVNSIYRDTKGEMMIWHRINFAPIGKDKYKAVFMSTCLTVKPFTSEVIDMFYTSLDKLECTVFYNADKKEVKEEPMPSKP